MLFNVEGELKEITLRYWDGERWSPDCFGELERTVPGMYKLGDGNDAYIVTANEFAQIVDYWQSEIDLYNGGGYSEQLGDKADGGIGREYELSVNDIAAANKATALAAMRKARGMTQQDLSNASGVKLTTIQKLDTGSHAIMRAQVGTVIQLARALGTTVEELVGQDLKQLYDGD